jgi:hypothetical protein
MRPFLRVAIIEPTVPRLEPALTRVDVEQPRGLRRRLEDELTVLRYRACRAVPHVLDPESARVVEGTGVVRMSVLGVDDDGGIPNVRAVRGDPDGGVVVVLEETVLDLNHSGPPTAVEGVLAGVLDPTVSEGEGPPVTLIGQERLTAVRVVLIGVRHVRRSLPHVPVDDRRPIRVEHVEVHRALPALAPPGAESRDLEITEMQVVVGHQDDPHAGLVIRRLLDGDVLDEPVPATPQREEDPAVPRGEHELNVLARVAEPEDTEVPQTLEGVLRLDTVSTGGELKEDVVPGVLTEGTVDRLTACWITAGVLDHIDRPIKLDSRLRRSSRIPRESSR